MLSVPLSLDPNPLPIPFGGIDTLLAAVHKTPKQTIAYFLQFFDIHFCFKCLNFVRTNVQLYSE